MFEVLKFSKLLSLTKATRAMLQDKFGKIA